MLSLLKLLPLAITACVCLTACSSGSSTEQTQTLDAPAIKEISKQLASDGKTDQAGFLEDGVVTAAEYDSAFQLLRTCVDDEGYSLTDPIVSPLTNTNYEFVFNSEGRDENQAAADNAQCMSQYWAEVSAVYGDTAPQKMDPPLAQGIISCMESHGYEVSSAAKSLKQIAGTDLEKDKERRAIAGECAQSSFTKLYPEIPGLTLAY